MEYASREKQIRIYFGKRKREFLNGKKLIKTILPTLLISLMLLLVLGDSMFQEVLPSKMRFFILACACIFYGIFNSLESVCSEREIIKHEHRSGMYISSYILGYAFFDFLVCLIHAIVTWLVVTVRYHSYISFLQSPGYLISMIIIVFCADALGLCVSSAVKKPEQAMKLMPLVMVLQVAFAGIFFDLPKPITNLTLSKWGTYAMFGIGFDLSGTEYPHFILCWVVLILMTVLFLGLAILFLQSIDKDQR